MGSDKLIKTRVTCTWLVCCNRELFETVDLSRDCQHLADLESEAGSKWQHVINGYQAIFSQNDFRILRFLPSVVKAILLV